MAICGILVGMEETRPILYGVADYAEIRKANGALRPDNLPAKMLYGIRRGPLHCRRAFAMLTLMATCCLCSLSSHAYVNGRYMKTTCPDCMGKGVVENRYGKSVPCKNCEGDGSVISWLAVSLHIAVISFGILITMKRYE